jgi:ABC-2 type transport system permease protein
MTAAAAVSPRALGRDAAGPGRGPTFPRIVASESTKVLSLRSTSWIAVVTVVASWVVTYLSANASSGDPGFEPLASLPDALGLSQIGLLVLGVLVGTGEFRTGAFRTTFTAVPRRVPVLVARTLVVAVVGAVVAVLTLAAAVLGILPAARSRDMALDLTADGTPPVLLGSGLMLLGMAVLGLAIGTLLRRTVVAVTVALGLVFVVPVALSLASDFATDPMVGVSVETEAVEIDPVSTVVAFLPGDAAFRMTTSPDAGGIDGAPDLGRVGGGLVFGAWILLPLAAAGVRLRARDVT